MRIDTVRELAKSQGLEWEESFDKLTILPKRADFKELFLDFYQVGFNYLPDIVGIDYLSYPDRQPERFALVYELVSLPGYQDGDGSRFFAKVFVPESDPMVPTVSDIWASANWLEREIYDLLGIRFAGHPNLRKILTPEDLEGYPLRKDFPLGETPTLFKEGRFIDPAAFRAGLSGKDPGLTGWRGGMRQQGEEAWTAIQRALKIESGGKG